MEAIFSDYSPRFLYVDKYHFTSKWIYPSNVAAFSLLRYIVSGTATFTLNGTPYEVGPDDVFYIPQGSMLTCAAKQDVVFISIRFVGSVLTPDIDMLEELWHVPHQMSFAGKPQMLQWFETVYASALSKTNFKMLEMRGCLNLILAELAKQKKENYNGDHTLEEDRKKMEALFDVKSIQQRTAKSIEQKNDPRITVLVDYITAHPAENLSHTQLCKMVDVSESTLRRLFKAKTGKTIYTFTREIKMTNAARRLLITNESISAIADSLGYDSLSYFGKCFRETYGMSPQEYRKTTHEV